MLVNLLNFKPPSPIFLIIHKQMDEDRIIWSRKKYFEKPMLCDNDGPFAKFRKWYAQFYAEDWRETA